MSPLDSAAALDLDELPKSLLVLGGGPIGVELAQAFHRLGSDVTLVEIAPHLLPAEEPALGDALACFLAQEGIRVLAGARVEEVARDGSRITARLGEPAVTITAERVLVATGRRADTTDLGLDRAGVEVDPGGFVAADVHLRTSAPTVFAAGDVLGPPMLVYLAARQGRLAAENALRAAADPAAILLRRPDPDVVPWIVFTDPQVAGAGLDLEAACARGFVAERSTLPLSELPRALAARDTRGFVSLVRDRRTDRVLGARAVAPDAGELMAPVALALSAGLTAGDLRESLFPYLTLSESLRLAAIGFERDVRELSCCAG